MAIELTLVPAKVSVPVKPPSRVGMSVEPAEQLLLELHEARQVEEERIVPGPGERLAAAADVSDAGGRRACRSSCRPCATVVPIQALVRADAPVDAPDRVVLDDRAVRLERVLLNLTR